MVSERLEHKNKSILNKIIESVKILLRSNFAL